MQLVGLMVACGLEQLTCTIQPMIPGPVLQVWRLEGMLIQRI